MTDHNLGDWITVTGSIVREGDESNFRRFWRRYDHGGSLRALVVGKRTLANGYVERYQETDGWSSYTVKTWIPEEHFPAYLVVTNLHNKPFYVHPDQISMT